MRKNKQVSLIRRENGSLWVCELEIELFFLSILVLRFFFFSVLFNSVIVCEEKRRENFYCGR